MVPEIQLTPQELYFMGSLMKAKYIDYTYVAAMEDIEQNYRLYRNRTRASLASKGCITEDLDGNIDIQDIAKIFLEPVFFGGFESSVDICYVQPEQRRVEVNKFHFLEDRITYVTGSDTALILQRVDNLFLDSFASKLLPSEYSIPTKELESRPPSEEISKVIAVKNVEIGKKNSVLVFAEANGLMFVEHDENSFTQLSRNDFISSVLGTIRRE